MTDRPKWMPDDDKIRACAAVDHVDSAHTKLYSVESTRALIHTSCLRAQIAALEDLISHMSQRYASQENPTGSYCNEESCWIAEKIAALRKELGE